MDITIEKEETSEDTSEYAEYEVYLKIVKQIVGIFVGAGVSHIVYEVVENNVTEKNKLQQVTTLAGKVAITMIVKDVVKDGVNKKIDHAFNWCMTNVKASLDLSKKIDEKVKKIEEEAKKLDDKEKKSEDSPAVEEISDKEQTEPLDD